MFASIQCKAEINFKEFDQQELTWHTSILNKREVMFNNVIELNEEIDTVVEEPEIIIEPLNEKIVNTAMQYLGVPYVWGGTTPDGFDCSGLVQYVYKVNEMTISRTTYTQVNEGNYVPKNELEQGDLVFFGRASSPHHVGIYIGDNKFIHAPQSGDVVKISNMSDRSDYATGRRIIN